MGRPSRTALGVANRRAVHQVLDQPPVLVDPIAVRILGSDFVLDEERQRHPFSRAFRAFMAARSRFAEDCLARAVEAGVRQYVLLGAGLDTFAYRNPFPEVRVFEVDFPATQLWKRRKLDLAGIPEPDNVTYVALDFEHHTLAEGLAAEAFDVNSPAFFGWLGVVPYLTLKAFRTTLDYVAGLPEGSGIAFDYALTATELSPALRKAHEALAERVARAGEPFKLFFAGEQMENELKTAGFQKIEQVDSIDLNERYFANRADGLTLPQESLGRLVAAWV
ncbi:class I SAM-dependent methyltransferase [Acidicapsa dinghuensis]|uniref:S-adenosyl-L-methionine-dependent methyltransferase n=1 Tax=Acidicapsa dinghuensis TaxID=2218256 RepID=A0ABW1EKK9_9BACT|nr:class I SAM-dependent methyltransferase [Acidicapsa dinghuensis]